MRDITIVFDPGSTWMGKVEYARKAIDLCKEAGADAIKFQLFEGEEYRKNGNIEMPLDIFKGLYLYGKAVGIPVTASVFNSKALEYLLSLGEPHHVKFAYSMRHHPMIRGMLNTGKRVVVTTNIHDSWDLPNQDNLIKLVTQDRCKQADSYCVNTKMNFDGLFPNRFQGFSDHSLGSIEAQAAVQNKAVWIEKHITLGFSDCTDVPDGRFALSPDEAKEFVWKVR